MSYSLTKRSMRRQAFGRWVAGDDDFDAGAPGVVEVGADAGVVNLGEVEGAEGVQLDAVGGVVGERGGLEREVDRQVVFDVFGIQAGDLQLLH